tara:strand:+ start:1483 stop:2493 length:1011 start_codon:yes stop_codon:yes gene_type:complete
MSARGAKPDDSHEITISVMGPKGSGKSNIINRFFDDQDPTYAFKPTLANVRYSKPVQVENEIVQLECWDTIANSKSNHASPSDSQHPMDTAHCCIICYDINDTQSYVDAKELVKNIKGKDLNNTIFLVGNKLDLKDSRKITEADAKDFADNQNIQYIETSAKFDTNIEQLFMAAADSTLNRLKSDYSEKANVEPEGEEPKVPIQPVSESRWYSPITNLFKRSVKHNPDTISKQDLMALLPPDTDNKNEMQNYASNSGARIEQLYNSGCFKDILENMASDTNKEEFRQAREEIKDRLTEMGKKVGLDLSAVANSTATGIIGVHEEKNKQTEKTRIRL